MNNRCQTKLVSRTTHKTQCLNIFANRTTRDFVQLKRCYHDISAFCTVVNRLLSEKAKVILEWKHVYSLIYDDYNGKNLHPHEISVGQKKISCILA